MCKGKTNKTNLVYTYLFPQLQQLGWVTSSHNISYDPPPTYTVQPKHMNIAIKHIFNYTKSYE